MTGVGQRFVDAGYKDLKPLIQVAGETIVSHVIRMYEGIEEILFIISKESPQKESLRTELLKVAPQAKIVEIAAHKLGPSYAIWEARKHVNHNAKVIVNYCDFAAIWNWRDMTRQLDKYVASVLTYTNFHPHMLRNSKYAYLKRDQYRRVSDIQEKESYTDNPMNEEASAGAYGFQSGEILISAIQEQMVSQLNLNGEYYTSLTVRMLIQQGQSVETVLASKFFQWGTPEDLAEWTYWHNAINSLNRYQPELIGLRSNGVLLAAGAGSRINKAGLPPKPRINVGGIELWRYSERSLSQDAEVTLVTRVGIGIHPTPNIDHFVELETITGGQAISAEIGLLHITAHSQLPVTVFSTDNVIPSNAHQEAVQQIHDGADIVVWVSGKYPPAKLQPSHYSWVVPMSEGSLQLIKKKQPEEENALMTIGNFTFRNSELALNLIQNLKANHIQINNEYYLDSVIEIAPQLGVRLQVLDVEDFFAVGTQNEYSTYKYWQEVANEYEFQD
jgi:bifunctional N-acetylglucosamine-1-phosphate-uridyltransferase/glucosamine-1-phosphate-acetyltransferase GlmU-like protein